MAEDRQMAAVASPFVLVVPLLLLSLLLQRIEPVLGSSRELREAVQRLPRITELDLKRHLLTLALTGSKCDLVAGVRVLQASAENVGLVKENPLTVIGLNLP